MELSEPSTSESTNLERAIALSLESSDITAITEDINKENMSRWVQFFCVSNFQLENFLITDVFSGH